MSSEVHEIVYNYKGEDKVIKISKEDLEQYKKHTWRVINTRSKNEKYKGKCYVVNGSDLLLHHMILGKPPKGHVVDHINGDSLDNTRSNLRFVTFAANAQNKKNNKEGMASKYKGVRLACNGKWMAESQSKYLGIFETEEDAAKMYDTYTFIVFGEHASNNNLVSYDDVKDKKVEDILKPKRELPTNIKMEGSKYRVNVKINKVNHNLGLYEDLDEAIKKRDEFLDEKKKKDDELHLQKPILRNESNQAIIPARNKNGDIVKYALVDDDKWHMLAKHSWRLDAESYFLATINKKPVKMHRLLMNAPDGVIVDHKNSIPYDNRLQNLRLASDSANAHNKKKKEGASSKYIGVSPSGNRWAAKISKGKERHNIGSYQTEKEAARAYNEKAKELYKEFANLNEISDSDDESAEDVDNIAVDDITTRLAKLSA